jgi:hypothetical protein
LQQWISIPSEELKLYSRKVNKVNTKMTVRKREDPASSAVKHGGGGEQKRPMGRPKGCGSSGNSYAVPVRPKVISKADKCGGDGYLMPTSPTHLKEDIQGRPVTFEKERASSSSTSKQSKAKSDHPVNSQVQVIKGKILTPAPGQAKVKVV